MKKYFLLAVLSTFLFCGIANSQTVKTMTSATHGSVLDTVTSTAAHYMVSGAIASMRVQVDFTGLELSGTTAGTATLEQSNDGTSWHSYYNAKDTSYSYTLTDVTTAQVFGWSLTDFTGKYLRIKVVGVSTPSFTIAGTYIIK